MKTFNLFDDIDENPTKIEQQTDTDDAQGVQNINGIKHINNIKSIERIENIKDIENTRGRYNPIARQRETEAKQRAAYKFYQEAIQKSGEIRDNITKGIIAGDSPYNLLLQAIECISLMAGEEMFLSCNKENLRDIHGIGLMQPALVSLELAEVRKRLTLLQRPELVNESANARQRINRAINVHQDQEEVLKRMIGRKIQPVY